MNFGDILDKWESGQSGSFQKNVMESWLRNNNVYDKDANINRAPAPGEYRRQIVYTQPDEILDIHGLSDEKAWLSLELFFTRARSCGFKKLRIIHGKGNRSQGEAVLKLTVRKYIEQCSFAGESGYEKAANGGSGATWVLLKQQ